MTEHKTKTDEYYYNLECWLSGISSAPLDIDCVKNYVILNSCLILKIPSENEESKAATIEFLENIEKAVKELTPNFYSAELPIGRVCSQTIQCLVCDKPCNTCLIAICEKVWKYC